MNYDRKGQSLRRTENRRRSGTSSSDYAQESHISGNRISAQESARTEQLYSLTDPSPELGAHSSSYQDAATRGEYSHGASYSTPSDQFVPPIQYGTSGSRSNVYNEEPFNHDQNNYRPDYEDQADDSREYDARRYEPRYHDQFFTPNQHGTSGLSLNADCEEPINRDRREYDPRRYEPTYDDQSHTPSAAAPNHHRFEIGDQTKYNRHSNEYQVDNLASGTASGPSPNQYQEIGLTSDPLVTHSSNYQSENPWQRSTWAPTIQRNDNMTPGINDMFGSINLNDIPARNSYLPKRLVLCLDGTGNNGLADKYKTNVWKIFDCLQGNAQSESTKCFIGNAQSTKQQLTKYIRGIYATENNSLRGKKPVSEGALGYGIRDKLRNGYEWLCNNYHQEWQSTNSGEILTQDEIYIVGFSRGAFTARALGLLIDEMGLLTTQAVKGGWVDFVFEKWPQRSEIEFLAPDEMRREDVTRENVRIKVCAVWDVVMSLHRGAQKDFPRVVSCEARNIDSTYHALCLNEQRSKFAPLLWKLPPGGDMMQCWFAGHHSDVGGGQAKGYPSNLSFIWMVDKLRRHLTFDDEKIESWTSKPLGKDLEFVNSLSIMYKTLGMIKLNKPEPRTQFFSTPDAYKDRVKHSHSIVITHVGKHDWRQRSVNNAMEYVHWSVYCMLKANLIQNCPSDPLTLRAFEREEAVDLETNLTWWSAGHQDPERGKEIVWLPEDAPTAYEKPFWII